MKIFNVFGMKYDWRVKTGIVLISIASVFFVLNIKTSIRQGINGKYHLITMPLYMKVSDFIVRGNRYDLLVDNILENTNGDIEKLNALFEWTSKNIRPIPANFPIVDDHVDNIIIRGYGSDDQSADVFTTLAVVAGFKAGIYLIGAPPDKKLHAISIVENDGKMLLFDTYCRFYFLNNDNEIASISDVAKDINLVRKISQDFKYAKRDYYEFYQNLIPVESIGWTKADLQIPSKRLIYIIGRLLRISEPSKVFYGEQFRD